MRLLQKSEVCAPDTDDSADSYVSDNDTSSSDPEFDSDASLSDNKVKQPARRVTTGGESKGKIELVNTQLKHIDT